MDITLLQQRDELFFNPLKELLSKITVRGKSTTSNRRGFPAKHMMVLQDYPITAKNIRSSTKRLCE